MKTLQEQVSEILEGAVSRKQLQALANLVEDRRLRARDMARVWKYPELEPFHSGVAVAYAEIGAELERLLPSVDDE